MVVFDFEREIIGSAQIEIVALEGATLEFGYAEHIENGRVHVFPEKSRLSLADRFTTITGK